MKKCKAVLLLVLSVIICAPRKGNGTETTTPKPAPGVAIADLWQKAVDIYRRNRYWYPQRISILSEVLNRHGEPYSVNELFFVLHFDAQGRMQVELKRGLKNGKDATEKMKSKVTIRNPAEGMAPNDENTYSVSISDSPFNPEQQGSVSYTPGEETQVLFGHSCRRFDFTFHTAIRNKGVAQKLTWIGMAWLEKSSGMPVKLEFSLAPLPGKIRSLWAIYFYDTARPDYWVVKNVVISGHGGFLFIKKRFRTTTTFNDYRLPPETQGSK